MWLKLTPELLKTHLADSEQEALNMTAVESENILAQECHNIAEAWRGRLKKLTIIDKRADYVPSELLQFILIHVRYASFTRLPQMESLLDKLRQEEWRRANQIFDDPTLIAIEEPEDPDGESDPMIVVDPRNFFLD